MSVLLNGHHVRRSARVHVEDLDWDLARTVGLTNREQRVVQHLADVEARIGLDCLALAKLEVAREPELSAFLVTWNYEAFFHAHALTRLMRACGIDTPDVTERRESQRARSSLRSRVEDAARAALAALMPRPFVALWMLWGALHSALMTEHYERLVATTRNPVLADLCRRIANQETRQFAFYFAQARSRLAEDPAAQRLCRLLARRFYAPAGSRVKCDDEVARPIAELFPRADLFALMASIERRIQELPGMSRFAACTAWATNVQRLLPLELQREPSWMSEPA